MIAVSMGYYDYFGLLRMRTRFRRVVIGHILHSDISDRCNSSWLQQNEIHWLTW